MERKENLFAAFEEQSYASWKEKVIKDLKGKDFDETLIWKASQNLVMEPYFTKEQMGELDYQKSVENSRLSTLPFGNARKWDNMPRVQLSNPEKDNKTILHHLQEGAEGIIVQSDQIADFDLAKLFEGVQFEYCAIAFEVAKWSDINTINNFIKNSEQQIQSGFIKVTEAVDSSNFDIAAVTNAVLPSICIEIDAQKGFAEALGDAIFQLYSITEKQLASADKAQLDQYFHLDFALHPFFFLQIAQIKAAQLLFNEVLKQYGKEDSNLYIHAHTVTGLVDPSLKIVGDLEKYNNLLSNTTQAISAVLGGCHSLTVNVHEQNDSTAERIARNVSTMLKEESYFDKVADPVAGSYYIAHAFDQIAENAWKHFQSKI